MKEKILCDPYYGSAYKRLHSLKKIYSAGFFDDGTPPGAKNLCSDPTWLSTPINKIIKRLALLNPSPKIPLAVLITTGAFCPPHRGHLEMMELAKRELEERDVCVLGGYLSPSHDTYVYKKYHRMGFPMLAAHRIQLCEQAVRESEWLMVDRWESLYNDRYINFTDVLVRLERYLATHIKAPSPIHIVYVFGGDNADFAYAFLSKGYAICIPRPGYERKCQMLSKARLFKEHTRIIFSKQSTAKPNVSSRFLHQHADAFPCSRKKTFSYLIRDEGNWSILPWGRKGARQSLMKARTKFRRKLAEVFVSEFRHATWPDTPIHLNIHFLNMQVQRRYARKLEEKIPTISLDPCVRGTVNLEISRAFALSENQYTGERLVSRPGKLTLKKQLKKIPAGEYMIVEDDIASSQTIKETLNLLPETISIRGISVLSQCLPEPMEEEALDIVDFRDFLAGSREGGLVVELPNNTLARAPYMLPYVSLVTRAKLPPSREMHFSRRLWELNREFFQIIDARLEEASLPFQDLMQYIGFTGKTLMREICEWHLARLPHYEIQLPHSNSKISPM